MARMLHTELEWIGNHLDVAVKLADAVGLAVATARFALDEERAAAGEQDVRQRFGRDVVVPGGVSRCCKPVPPRSSPNWPGWRMRSRRMPPR
jgi:formate hydrogenlyase subunit 5